MNRWLSWVKEAITTLQPSFNIQTLVYCGGRQGADSRTVDQGLSHTNALPLKCYMSVPARATARNAI